MGLSATQAADAAREYISKHTGEVTTAEARRPLADGAWEVDCHVGALRRRGKRVVVNGRGELTRVLLREGE